jgi:hypothetical protein
MERRLSPDQTLAQLGYSILTQSNATKSPFSNAITTLYSPSPCLRTTVSSQVLHAIEQCVCGISTQIYLSVNPSAMKLACIVQLFPMMEGC